jgi:hypothetical protein
MASGQASVNVSEMKGPGDGYQSFARELSSKLPFVVGTASMK